ncbi:MAG TPA: asparaginase [Candidatus Baltobacteraceae bacterium]|nr:asparaginase [Candidatus Baltobacteraceae bacterium]
MSKRPSHEQPYLTGEPVVEVTRGDAVESIHHVAACAMDDRAEVTFALGAIDVPVFLRSAAKPFIAAAAVRAGVVERFGLEPRELAVMAASHTGQAFHVEAVRSILRKIGLDESALQCGAHAPYNAAAAAELAAAGIAPTAIHNNCSGKHAGILALCKAIGADPQTYMELHNAAEQQILELCARLSGERAAQMPIGVDGCGIPVYATPLRNAALSFMRFATLQVEDPRDARALSAVRDAMIAHPEYVSGTGEFDTRLMQAGGGTLACKSGAEGVHGLAALAARAGLAVKVLDGASRARGPAVITLLGNLGLTARRVLTDMADFERPIVYNRAGRAVGEIRAAGTIAVEKASTN